MQQILQSLRTGETSLVEVPVPRVQPGTVLIQTTRSLVSLGTERMLVEFGKANWIQKARQQPDKVRQVLDKIRTEGLLPTVEAVFNKLDQPLPLGYCNVGRVVALGAGVSDLRIGDRVVSNGPHAEYVCVPRNLVAAVPDGVSDEEAAFTVIGAIGLQGIRLLAPTFGETVVVVGLGLIGLMAAELLHASGCRVIGTDIDPAKIALAREKGIIGLDAAASDPVAVVQAQTNGVGADAVLITASAKTSDIISQAARMSRKRGRIVLVGVIGLELNRAEFYEKELTFQVSCSYGPGRYDDHYEQKGIDYPLPFVRWTEQRNFEAILAAIAAQQLNLQPLITQRVPLADYRQIYDDMGGKHIASLLEYPAQEGPLRTTIVLLPEQQVRGQQGGFGIIGAGNFTKMTMLPALDRVGAPLVSIASASGVSSTSMAAKHGIRKTTTDYHALLTDPEVSTVLITTRHNAHARMVVEALEAGKHVFVEKPLALTTAELDQIIAAQLAHPQQLIAVGFNRRFSPHAQQIKALLGDDPGPIHVIATMNAGFIPPQVWVHDPAVGGGRIIGEACHLIDLISFCTGSRVSAVCANRLSDEPAATTDNASLLLRYANGSNGVVNYFANGSSRYSKERLELHWQGRTIVMDNFRETVGYGIPGFRRLRSKLDKGHQAQFALLAERVAKGGEPPIPFHSLVNTTRASFAAVESLQRGEWINVSE